MIPTYNNSKQSWLNANKKEWLLLLIKKSWRNCGKHEQIHAFMCRGSTCNLASKVEKNVKKKNSSISHRTWWETFYGIARSNFLAQDPLSSLNKIYSILVQEECMKSITQGKEVWMNEIRSFAVKSNSKTDGMDQNLIYQNCNILGHDSGNYF